MRDKEVDWAPPRSLPPNGGGEPREQAVQGEDMAWHRGPDPATLRFSGIERDSVRTVVRCGKVDSLISHTGPISRDGRHHSDIDL